MKGQLFGVGVGPGDPQLLTLQAVDVIGRCPVVAVPASGGGEQMALAIVADYIGDKEVLHCDLPMTRDRRVLQDSWDKAARLIAGRLEAGQDVAFLTLGDPGIYATYGYIHRLVLERGYEASIVPGITSFQAAAAQLGETLCLGEEPLQILPGAFEGLEEALDRPGSKVLMKLGSRRDQVLETLSRKGLLERSAMVERCTLPDQAVYRDLTALPEKSGYFSVVLVKEG